jgi:DNA repair protein RecO (recombination protein O)
MPERDTHEGLFEALGLLVRHLDEPSLAGELVARFELLILEELGFGLDLSQCAATGARADLAYVSPKSGRAVSREAGSPWHDKMLLLPDFLVAGPTRRADPPGLDSAFRLTGFFLTRHVYEPRGIAAPEARGSFLSALRRLANDRAPGENAA